MILNKRKLKKERFVFNQTLPSKKTLTMFALAQDIKPKFKFGKLNLNPLGELLLNPEFAALVAK